MKQETFKELYTNQGEELVFQRTIRPEHQPWMEYPRPQMKRDSYINLNGTWDFQLSESGQLPDAYTEEILVPFPPQSLLSRIHRDISAS